MRSRQYLGSRGAAQSRETSRRMLVVLGVLACLSACGWYIVQGTVRDRFRHDYGCDGDVEVVKVAGTTYSAQGCGESATYTCANSETCVRESQPLARRAPDTAGVAVRVEKWTGQAKTTRLYDEQKKLHVVRAEFTALREPIEIILVGAPQVELTTVFARLQVKGMASQKLVDCETLQVLINDEPFEGEAPRFSKTKNIWAVDGSAKFRFELFKPLGRSYATFGVRACDTEVKLEENQMDELLKFFEIFSQIAIDVQNEALPTRDSDALII
jgi:hypothetical protein